MKLRSIYIICKQNYKKIEGVQGKEITLPGNKKAIRVTGWIDVIPSLEELKQIECIHQKVEDLIDTVPTIYYSKESFDLDLNDWKKTNSAIRSLLNAMSVILSLCNSLEMHEMGQQGIDIKLPHCSDFSDYVEYVNDLEFVFTKCPFLKDENEEFQFQNVDIGSTWLTFIIVAAGATGAVSAAVSLLEKMACFIDKCFVLRSHALTLKEQKIKINEMEHSEKEKETILQGVEEIYDMEVHQVIHELEEETNYTIKDGDEFGRVKTCIEKMNNLIDKGVQIYTTIDAPEQTKAVFEPLETKYLQVDNELKLLEKKSEEKE